MPLSVDTRTVELWRHRSVRAEAGTDKQNVRGETDTTEDIILDARWVSSPLVKDPYRGAESTDPDQID
jgi:hypothetical protein